MHEHKDSHSRPEKSVTAGLQNEMAVEDPSRWNSSTPGTKSHATKDSDSIIYDDSKYCYGWFGFTPDWLQWANTAWMYCLLMTVANTFNVGSVAGVSGVVQSSIERRFSFTSQQMSWISVSYEIFSLLVAIFITWLGTVGCHRPRWVALCLLSSAAGCIVFALPHFVTEEYQPGGVGGGEEDYLCSNRTGIDLCDHNDEEGSSEYVIVIVFLVLARVFLAFGGGGLYTLGITFLDDSLTKPKFSLYSSMVALGGVLGPALGFIAGGLCLNIYTEYPKSDGSNLGLEPGDPQWVGAWWLPLIVFGICISIMVPPLSGYPADLPGSAEIRANKKTEAFDVKKDEIPDDMTKIDFTRKDLWPYTKELFTNVTFIFLSLYVCCDMSILSAFTVFGPKYVEVMFSLTAAQGGIVLGLMVVPAGIIGTVAAGVVIDKLKLDIRQIMKTEFLVSIMVIFMGTCFLVQCNQADFAGVNSPYEGSLNDLNITDGCNIDCMCDDLPYSPVCSHENVQYFSPCHAGCTDRVEDEEEGMLFFNCSCISPPDLPLSSEGSWKVCNNPECNIAAFSVLMFAAMIGLFMSQAMNISAVIRSVPNKQRMYALFISSIIIRFVGSTPGLLILAAIFDASCILWEDNCDSQGSCFYYDNQRLGYLTMTYAVCTKFVAIICMLCAFMFYKPPQVFVSEQEIVAENTEGDSNKKYFISSVNNEFLTSTDEITEF